MHNYDQLASACLDLEQAKAAESEARRTRLATEERVLALMGELPHEGTTSTSVADFKLTVTQSIRRTVDADKLAEIAPQIPEAIGKRLIRWKPDLVTRELRFLESNEPQIYGIVAQAITAKPGKPSVKVERIDDVQEAA